MNVGSLFAKLGIDLDAASFAAAEAKLQALRARAEEAMSRVRENTDHFNQVVLDVSRQARAASGEMDDALLDWSKGAKQGINWTKAWEKTIAGVTSAYRVARKAVIGIVVGGAVLKGLGHLADAYTGVRSRINQMTDDTELQVKLQDRLFKSAQDTATAYSDVGMLYQQIGIAAKANGRTLEQGAEIVDTINKAIKSSGASAEGASKALTQLGQGLGSGTLRGEEFNAVIEQAPVLIDLIAKSMGKTRGEMRKLADGGKLTSKVIIKALEQQKGAVEDAYAKRLPQVGDLFVRLRNTVSKALSDVFQKREVVEGLKAAFVALTAALTTTIEVIAAVALAMARHPGLVKGIAVAVLALAAAFAVMKVQAALAWLAALGPIALVAAGVVAVIAAFVLLGSRFAKIASSISRGWDSLWRTVDMKLRRFFSGIKSFFADLAGAVKSVFYDIVNSVISGINKGIWLLNKAIRLANKIPGVNIGTVGELGRVGDSGGGDGGLYAATLARFSQIQAAAAAGSRPATTLPTRPLATMPTVGRRTQMKQYNVNNNGPVSINVNGAGDPEAVATAVYKQLRDQDMHNALAGLDDSEEPA